MKAVILAAGKGSRLRPYTADRPKPLVTLAGRSLLAHTSATLADAGVTDQIVVTGYAADKIREHGYATVRNHSYAETEMVYSLFTAESEFPTDQDLLVSYGDILYESRIVRRLAECEAPICVAIDTEWRALWELRFDDPLTDAETLQQDPSGCITEIGNHPASYADIDGQYIGLFTIRADKIDAFVQAYEQLNTASGVSQSADQIDMTSFLQYLIDRGWTVKAVPIERGWVEVDTVEDLETYRRLHEQDSLRRFVELPD